MTFISDEQRNKLKSAYEIIKSVHDKLSYDYVEYDIIKTSIDALERGIKYQDTHY